MSRPPVRLPMWAREIQTLLPITSQFVLSGNCRDLFVIPTADGFVPGSLADTVSEVFRSAGIQTVLIIDAGGNVTRSVHDDVEKATGLKLPMGKQFDLPDLTATIEAVADAPKRMALIIDSASRLARDPAHLSDDEFQFFRSADHVARRARPRTRDGSGPAGCYNPIVWVMDSDRELPDWLVVPNPGVRAITVGLPDQDARFAVAEVLLANLPPPSASSRIRSSSARQPAPSGTGPDQSVSIFLEQTAGMKISDMRRIADLAEQQGFGADQIADAARSYRVGVVDSPWKQTTLSDRLRTADASLAERVLGQQPAIRRAVDLLIRSAMGLGGSHMSSGATRPRGILFLAGPTGVGKTELAKGLSHLLFGDENQMIRFDMSEFAEPQAAERLIGAPPGFVGHDVGGELTNAVRQRPFSLVLFDEIEKAHPRILDKFLQILDDGRLTDGRGQTVFFTETFIVFTSNLGVYEDVVEGGQVVDRKSRFSMDAPLESVQEGVTKAIQQYFTRDLMRPELFGRLGDNVVVFDFIRPEIARQILRLQVNRVIERVRHIHRLELEVDPAAFAMLERHCLTDLSMGGRGIGSRLETSLTNTLSRTIFEESRHDQRRRKLRLIEDHGTWTTTLEPA